MELYLLNSDFTKDKVIDVFETILWSEQFNQAGFFEFTIRASEYFVSEFVRGRFIGFSESDKIMVVDKVEIELELEDGDRLIVTGRSLESILDTRIVLETIEIDGNLQNGIETILNQTMISPTDTNRTISNLYFTTSTNPDITSLTLHKQVLRVDVYKAIVDICKEKDIGFQITENGGNLYFELIAGTNRATDQITNPHVIFSRSNDNLISSEYIKDGLEYKNVAIVAGEGDGEDRVTETAGDTSSTGLDRREVFISASDITRTVNSVTMSEADYKELLEQKGLEELKELEITSEFDTEISDTYRQYNTDYFLGDYVQVISDYDLSHKVRFVEFVRYFDKEGYTERPKFKIV